MGERQTHWREIDGRETDTLKRDRWEREGDVLSHLYPIVCVCVHMCVCVYICVSMSAYVCACVSACDGVYVCDCVMYTCAIASCIRVRLRHDCLLIQTMDSVFQRACIFFGGRGGTSKHFGIIHGDFERRDHHWQPSSRALCVCMSHVRYNKESHHTHQGAKSHISSIFFDTQMTKSFYTYM